MKAVIISRNTSYHHSFRSPFIVPETFRFVREFYNCSVAFSFLKISKENWRFVSRRILLRFPQIFSSTNCLRTVWAAADNIQTFLMISIKHAHAQIKINDVSVHMSTYTDKSWLQRAVHITVTKAWLANTLTWSGV